MSGKVFIFPLATWLALSILGCNHVYWSSNSSEDIDLSSQFLDIKKDQGPRGVCYFYAYVAGLEAVINRNFPTRKVAIDEEAAELAYIDFALSPRVKNCKTCDWVQFGEKNHFINNLYFHFNYERPYEAGAQFDLIESQSIIGEIPTILMRLPLFSYGTVNREKKVKAFDEINNAVFGGWNSAWTNLNPFQIVALRKAKAIKESFKKVKEISSMAMEEFQKSGGRIELNLHDVRVIGIVPQINTAQQSPALVQNFILGSLKLRIPLVAGVNINGAEAFDESTGQFYTIDYGYDSNGVKKEVGHSMVLVGIKTFKHKEFYIFKNSWGMYGATVRIPLAEISRFERLEILLGPNDVVPPLPSAQYFDIFTVAPAESS